jgi:hypothetical protein
MPPERDGWKLNSPAKRKGMKTYNHLLERIYAFENLLLAARRAKRCKRLQDTIGRFRTVSQREPTGRGLFPEAPGRGTKREKAAGQVASNDLGVNAPPLGASQILPERRLQSASRLTCTGGSGTADVCGERQFAATNPAEQRQDRPALMRPERPAPFSRAVVERRPPAHNTTGRVDFHLPATTEAQAGIRPGIMRVGELCSERKWRMPVPSAACPERRLVAGFARANGNQ